MASIGEDNNREPTESGLAPVYDNFYSPENGIFYAENPYKPLHNHEHEIRLLRFLPPHNMNLSFTLLDNIPLTSVSGKYTALSYCAGNPKNTARIIINGLEFNAFANLGLALKEVMTYWRRTGALFGENWLWVDQVCINQSDPGERSHQVELMREIYAGAERVLVCLSERECSGVGMRWLVDLREKLRSKNCPGIGPDGIGGLVHDLAPEKTFCSYEMTHLVEKSRPETHETHKDFLCLTSSPWFSRCWTCQEFILARDVIFLYGWNSMEWMDFAVILFHYLGWRHAHFNSGGPFFRPRNEDTLMMGQLQSLLFLMAKKYDFNRSGKVPAVDLKVWLHYGRGCESSDPRDKVFAFLGLVSDDYQITPNYETSSSAREVMADTAARIITVDKNLDLLLYTESKVFAESRGKGLPSWAPDWTIKFISSTPKNTQSSSVKTPRVEDNTRLLAEGIRLDHPETSFGKSLRAPQNGKTSMFGGDLGKMKAREEVVVNEIPWETLMESKLFQKVKDGNLAWFLDQGLQKETIEIR
ncbi:hypothetical protein N431DRAFT_561970 [Stipitochalara longipes BDJ]|nr:hypothetical protein N431DRAFT_561970 [Stipitochalara longipes BDJ]